MMETEIKIGNYNTLKMTRVAERPNPHAYGGKESFGIFLDGGKEGEILMPQKYVPEHVKAGSDVHCFVYLDQDERLIATTEKPLAKVGDFAYLKCSWVNEYGAFLDWGLMKDLFCPFREQKRRMEIGESYIVYVYVDKDSYRVAATAKVDRWLHDVRQDNGGGLHKGVEVDLLVWQKTELGFKVIINNRYAGLVYKDQVFQYIHTGDRVKGYIMNVREDGKIDVSLQPLGRRQTLDFAETLLEWIKAHDGHCPFSDKSTPDDIKREFQVSKKVFKKAVGDLYKKQLITISDNGLELTKKG